MPTSSNDNFAIRIRNLSKSYTLKNAVGKNEKLIALDNVSMDIKQGEAIGIIGPNGSGKSTLLKILSEITAPDSGSVEINGKVASILEVGTGFNPDLSGRKNIYLNARLHGMKKAEVDTKFQQIVDLFGFPNFLDTPVKHYSSGMYMRLAFAVVVHIDADIYLFDEVLSVGDVEFQRKAPDTILELKQKNKTVLIVSHHLSQIDRICDKLALFTTGKIIQYGNPFEVGIFYSKAHKNKEIRKNTINTDVSGEIIINDTIKLTIQDQTENQEQVGRTLSIATLQAEKSIEIQIVLNRRTPSNVISLISQKHEINLRRGSTKLHVQLNKTHLLPGNYSIDFFAFKNGVNIASKLDLTDFSFQNNNFIPENQNPYWIFQVENNIMHLNCIQDEN
jgi:ABC-type polysaccharide/polyol phosphate transport system ATPase subunit